jgi:hypothetical protein
MKVERVARLSAARHPELMLAICAKEEHDRSITGCGSNPGAGG